MKKGLILCVPIALFATSALAGDMYGKDTEHKAGMTDKDQTMQRFNKLDTDKSGSLSQTEVQGQHRVIYYWPSADRNSDGSIDITEFSAFEVEVPAWEEK